MKKSILFLLVLLLISNSYVNAQQSFTSSKINNTTLADIHSVNAAIKNGGTPTIMALDSIPSCSAQWTYTGGTGVVPDNNPNGITMNFNINDINGTTLGTDVNFVGVYLNIQHYRIGDLSVQLIAPNGTVIQLVERMGYPATLPFGCTGKNINATFLRGTGFEAENECNVPPPALKGVRSAEFGFNLNDVNLAGGSPNGQWKIKVIDNQAGEVGYVLGWKMYFDQQPPNAVYTINTSGLFVSLAAQNTLQGNANYFWTFSDGDTAVGQFVTHQFPVRGQYTITLYVTDICGADTVSGTYSLEKPPCFATFGSTTTPTTITDNNFLGDTLIINANQVIGSKLGKDVQLRKVCIEGTHTRVGDLKMKLISPGGVEILLVDRPYHPFQQPFGCLNANFDFCIQHGDSADTEDECKPGGMAIIGDFTAMTPQDLRSVNDLVTNPNGVWKLVVYDMAAGSTGVVTNWSLLFDQQDPDPTYTYTFQGLNVNITSRNLPAVNYRWDFGDGTALDLNPSPTHTYASPGKKTIIVYTDNVCSADTLIKNITLYDCEEEFAYPLVPVAIPDVDSTGILIPFTITDIDGINLGVDAFLTRVCITSDHVWPGDLKIQIVAPNGKTIPILNQPTQSLTIDGCGAPGIDMCLVEGQGNDTRFVCDYVNAPPAIAGFYTGTPGFPLETINQGGGSPNGTWYLKVFDYGLFNIGSITSWKLYFGKLKPNVDFSYTANDTGLTSFVIPNAQTSYLWVFDNGDTSTSLMPTHQYYANGIYLVKLIAIDTLCLSDSITKEVYITSFNNGCVSPYVYNGPVIQINDADSTNGSVLNFNVSNVVGDSLGVNVNLFRVAVKGVHGRIGDLSMKLIAPNGNSTYLMDRPGYPESTLGCMQNDFQFILSSGQGPNMESVCNETGLAVFGLFQSDKLYDLGTLNFGGGSPNGNWQLVVYDHSQDFSGQVSGFSLYFDGQPTYADFIYNVKTDTVTFRHAANNDANYKWSFGDGTFSNQKFPTKIYTDTGYYAVTLRVTDSCGTDSITQMVNIIDVRPKCVEFRSFIGPKNIPSNNPVGVFINLNVNNIIGTQLGNDVRLVKVRVKGTITRVSDLTAKLYAPNGVVIDLFDRVGYPAKPLGCERDDFDAWFIKGVGPGAEDVCNLTGSALAGTFTAANYQNLNSINVAGGNPNGLWRLFMSDLEANALGKLDTFELYFDGQGVVDPSFTYTQSLNALTFTSKNLSDVKYSWNFGDGAIGVGASATHTYTVSGNYTITCYAKDSCRLDSSQQVVNIKAFSEPTSCIAVNSVIGLPIAIPNGNTAGIDLIINASGIKGSNLGVDVNLFKVKVIGKHKRIGDVKIEITAPNGQQVMLMDRPGYPATATGCGGDDFNFNIVRGKNASVENICFPALVPTLTGDYSGSNNNDLDSINSAGGSPNGNWIINISDNEATVGGGTIDTVELYFDNQTSVDAAFTSTVFSNAVTCDRPSVAGVSYLYAFGDGSTAATANATHAYAAAGTYIISLMATDSCGTTNQLDTVTVGGYLEPLCSKAYDYSMLPVEIPDTNVVTVSYNLTNILGTTLGSDVHLIKVCLKGLHNTVGDLKATLIAPNGTSVELMNRPGYPAGLGCTGNDFDFCVLRGAGNTLENVCDNLIPALSGNYTASDGFNLDSINIYGGSPNGTWTLVLEDLSPADSGMLTGFSLVFDNQQGVDASFNYNAVAGSVQFNAVYEPLKTYHWDFGDLSTSTDSNPVHNYAASGSYQVTLAVTDSCGTDSTSQTLNVTAYPEPICLKAVSLINTPVEITDGDSVGVLLSNTLSNVFGNALGIDVNLTKVCVKGMHTSVGDIKLVLVAPNGVQVSLMDQPGVPVTSKGCIGDDFDFCIVRGLGNTNETVCNLTSPAISGIFTTMDGAYLDSINIAGGTPNGLWQVLAYDKAVGDTGQVISVDLYFDNQDLTDANFTYTIAGKDFQGTSANIPNATYLWTFGNSFTSTDANPLYTYPTNGNYTVTLTATDSCGSKTTSQNIEAFSYPEPSCAQSFEFTGLPLSIVDGDSMGVAATMNLLGVDGTVLGTDVNLVQVCISGIHTKVGDLKAVLVAPNGAMIELVNQPGFPIGSGCLGQDFDFCIERGVNNSIENICNPTSPALSGIFTASEGFNLDSINIAGGSPNGQWKLFVYDLVALDTGQLLSVHLIFDNQNQVNPSFSATITNNIVQCTSANILNTNYNWTFSDGFTSTDANPVHAFGLTGTYTITVVASDSCGADSSSQTVNVIAYALPTCTKTYELITSPVAIPDNDPTGQTILLTVSDVVGALGVDVSLVSVCINGMHSNVGDLRATLTAPNGSVLNLMNRPGFPATATGCTGDDFNFCVVRGVGVTVENVCNVTAPAIAGDYNASIGFNLDSINIAGGSPNGVWKLKIFDLAATETGQLLDAHLVFDNQPHADASFSSLTTGYVVDFTSLNQNGINYNWNFGDGNNSLLPNPSHSYLSNGTYTVTLTAGDSCGNVILTQQVNIAVPITCEREYSYAAVPVVITDNDTMGVLSTYTLNGAAGNVLGVDVRLTGVCVTGTHSNVGDLTIKLTAPNNKVVTLLNRPGYPATSAGCTGDDFNFCISGGEGFDNENVCNVTAPAISGIFSAIADNLDSINYYGGNPNGDWFLNVSDNNVTETGSLTSWKLLFNGQPPIADFTYIILGSDVTFTASTIPNATYSWNFGDLGISNLQNPTHTYLGNGVYQVVLTVTDSCGTSLGAQLIPITVGIDNLNSAANVQVIPNPASNYIDLKITNTTHEKLTVYIVNGLGQNVFSTDINEQTNQLNKHIDCSNWSKGVYYVKLVSATLNTQQKLIIQ